MNVNKWETAFMINKYGKPVDRTEWDMEPQTYNAYYNPSNNEIVIPGCNIIVPGYEKKMADDAILYGIIGGTIGHEITHGFDDQGSQYDEKGNLENLNLAHLEKGVYVVKMLNNNVVRSSKMQKR